MSGSVDNQLYEVTVRVRLHAKSQSAALGVVEQRVQIGIQHDEHGAHVVDSNVKVAKP